MMKPEHNLRRGVWVALVFALGGLAMAQKIATRTVALPNTPVTAISGRSWLNHLGAFVNETSMGKTGQWGPAPSEEEDLAKVRAKAPGGEIAIGAQASGTIALTGADLYRLECQGCHRTDGRGVPPEINSMINPVRATSPELIRKHMEEMGAPMTAKDARELASQSQSALVQRISHGGLHMPGFLDLNTVEIQALVAYVNQLAGVPGAETRQIRMNEPTTRVGEHLIKATCHICHDATGPKPSAQEMMDGMVPPLSTLTRTRSLNEFVAKVTEGAPVSMGVLELHYRGRMPVFYYIRPEEAAAAYMYLTMYPPGTADETDAGSRAAAPANPGRKSGAKTNASQ
ncbi:MAG: c-type cytochrome [Acidobacteria bacterium]|nr:c-type cytochrome [Acidobacteriota bacterium]